MAHLLNRMNLWQRIGFIITIMWGIGFPIYEFVSIEHQAGKVMENTVAYCLEYKLRPSLELCIDDGMQLYRVRREGFSWASSFLISGLLSVFGWVAAYSLKGIVGWIAKGRQSGQA